MNRQQLKKAYLNFNNKETVDRLMKMGILKYHEHEMKISRYLPKGYALGGYITANILLTIHGGKIPEFDLKKYFEKFGRIVDAKWHDDNEMILEFAE